MTASGDYFTSPSIRTNNNHRINSWQGSGQSQTYNGSYYGHVGRPSPIQNVLRSGNSGLSGSSWCNTSYTSLEHLRGKVVREAKDQGGHVFLAKILDRQKLEEIDLIFLEIRDHVLDLVVDQFRHRVIEKVFKVCNQEQMMQLIHPLVINEQTFYGLCISTRGNMHHLLERRINDFKLRLLSHPFGAKVLEKSGRKNFRNKDSIRTWKFVHTEETEVPDTINPSYLRDGLCPALWQFFVVFPFLCLSSSVKFCCYIGFC